MIQPKWIKLSTMMFDDKRIKLIEAMPCGRNYVYIWLKMLCFAGKDNNKGRFTLGERAMTVKELSTLLGEPAKRVARALAAFKEYGLLDIIDGIYTVLLWEESQSLDAYEKRCERDREYQAKRRAEKKEISRRLIVDSSADVGIAEEDKEKEEETEEDIEAEVGNNLFFSSAESPIATEDTADFEARKEKPPLRWGAFPKEDEGSEEVPHGEEEERDAFSGANAAFSFSQVPNSEAFFAMSEEIREVPNEEAFFCVGDSIAEAKEPCEEKKGDGSYFKSGKNTVYKDGVKGCADLMEDECSSPFTAKEEERAPAVTVMNLFNSLCASYSKVRSMDGERKRKTGTLLKKYSLSDFEHAFKQLEGSDYLKGKNERGWMADIDWVLREDNFVKVLEGKYCGGKRGNSSYERVALSALPY